VALNSFKVKKSLHIKPEASPTLNEAGDLGVDTSLSNKMSYSNGSTTSQVVTESHTATLTNKTFDADGTGNVLSNIDNANIKSAAAIDATKVADGSVSNTEFQYINSLTSNAQTQISAAQADADAAQADATQALADAAAAQSDADDAQADATQALSDAADAQQDIDDHIADASGAHAATAISNTPAGSIAATTVQAAINELDGDVGAVSTGLSDHLSDAADAHDASAISSVAAGGLSSTDVQSALNELDTEKAPLASPALTGVPTAPTAAGGTNTTQLATTAFVQAAVVAAGGGVTVTPRSANATVSVADGLSECDASGGAFTLTLPTAVGIEGAVLRFIKADSSLNLITIEGDGAETIEGYANRKLATIGECLTIYSDGANWGILDRRIPARRAQYTPTFSNLGTMTSVEIWSHREGPFLVVEGCATSGTLVAATAAMSLGFNGVDGGLVIENITLQRFVGNYFTRRSEAAKGGTVLIQAGGGLGVVNFSTQNVFSSNSTSSLTTGLGTQMLFGNNEPFALYAKIPIVGWEG
jgi:hypothetical protein